LQAKNAATKAEVRDQRSEGSRQKAVGSRQKALPATTAMLRALSPVPLPMGEGEEKIERVSIANSAALTLSCSARVVLVSECRPLHVAVSASVTSVTATMAIPPARVAAI
jgi:hypothetical protein